MEITTFIIEKKTRIAKYILTFDEFEVQDYINSLTNVCLEDYHVENNSIYINNDQYLPTTVINSTDSLIDYLKATINSEFLNLKEVNLLFTEYDNKMYSPVTANVFLQLFSFMKVEKVGTMSLQEASYLYRMQHLLGYNYLKDNTYEKIDYAKENTKAFNRLGINLKERCKLIKTKQKSKLLTT